MRKIALLGTFFVMVVAIAIINGSSIASLVWSNVGWIYLVQTMVQHTSGSASTTPAEYFINAIAHNPDNQRAYLGAGMTHAEALNESSALRFWQQGNVSPEMLKQLGQQSNIRGRSNTAFIYFRSADILDPVSPGEGHFLAGTLCRVNLANLSVLSSGNQQYCLEYFADNANNLILDGQFEHEIDWGWTGSFFFNDPSKATVGLDHTVGIPAPSLIFTALTDERHNGIYQRVSLQPGTTVRFSGNFRVSGSGGLSTWLLYVGWRQDGRSQGTHFHTVESDMEWTYMEWDFTLPHGSEPWAQFYPILLRGVGSVWADNVTVQILSQ